MDTSDLFRSFEASNFTALGKTRTVYRKGAGPNVLVLSEMPGITPALLKFCDAVVDAGCSVTMPHLFGRDGREYNTKEFAKTFGEVCVSKEFTLFALGKASPITKWLTELAHHEHRRHGGPGVGVVGMCLTGGFALAMMVDPVVVAPVLSQPSLPVGLTKRARRDLGISEQDLAVVQDRVAGGTCVMALRFSEDGTAPKERFGRLREVLGENFIGVELDSSEGNEWGYPQSAHSVLTDATSFDLASPAGKALRDVVAFFTRQLEVAV